MIINSILHRSIRIRQCGGGRRIRWIQFHCQPVNRKEFNWKTKPAHVHKHTLKLTPPSLTQCRHIRRHASRDEIRRRKWHSKQIHLLNELSWTRMCNRFARVSSENCIDANIFLSFRRLSRRVHLYDMRSDVQNYFACEWCAKMVKSLWNPYKIYGKNMGEYEHVLCDIFSFWVNKRIHREIIRSDIGTAWWIESRWISHFSLSRRFLCARHRLQYHRRMISKIAILVYAAHTVLARASETYICEMRRSSERWLASTIFIQALQLLRSVCLSGCVEYAPKWNGRKIIQKWFAENMLHHPLDAPPRVGFMWWIRNHNKYLPFDLNQVDATHAANAFQTKCRSLECQRVNARTVDCMWKRDGTLSKLFYRVNTQRNTMNSPSLPSQHFHETRLRI